MNKIWTNSFLSTYGWMPVEEQPDSEAQLHALLAEGIANNSIDARKWIREYFKHENKRTGEQRDELETVIQNATTLSELEVYHLRQYIEGDYDDKSLKWIKAHKW